MSWLARCVFWIKETAMQRGTPRYTPKAMAHRDLSREEIDRLAWQKLQETVRFAMNNVPHYQRTWADCDVEAALASPEAYAQLPLCDRVEINASGLGFVAPKPRGRVLKGMSSGTTRNRFAFWSDARRSGRSMAARIRARRWWGIQPGDRSVLIYGVPFAGDGSIRVRLKHWLMVSVNRLCGQSRRSAYHMNLQDMRDHLSAIERAQPRLVVGYGHTLVHLAERREQDGAIGGLDDLKAVFYMSDPMTEQGRATTSRVFGAPVASEYSTAEFGLVAHECPHGNYHLSDDNLYVEVVNDEGQPVVGEIGDIILSDLHISRTPYLRYWLGDMGELAPADYVCPCGCTQRVLRHFHGRSHSVIRLRDGGVIPPMALGRTLSAVPGAHHWQAHVSGMGTPDAHILFEIETTAENLAPLVEPIGDYVAERVNHEFAVTVVAVDHIEPAPSGKYIPIVIEDEA